VAYAQISVSGLSSGAYAAVQYHLIYSSDLDGAGIIAGGPFWCAQGSMVTALTTCMSVPSGIVLSTLIAQTNSYYKSGLIDNPANLQNQKVWLFSGTKDTVVYPGVMDALYKYYGTYMNAIDISTNFNTPAEHAFITNNYGNICAFKGSPYINNCAIDGAGTLLQTIYGKLHNYNNASSANVKQIPQAQFLPFGFTIASASIGSTGYYYMPSHGCQTTACKIHIAFHGCQQTTADIGTKYVEFTGYNNWAEANSIIVLYPQAAKSYFSPLNPNGCWDWWGYVNANYATNKGVQMVFVNNMVKFFESTYNIA